MHYQLPQRIGDAIRRHELWSSGQRVAVAVSGGVDSVVLLHALVETSSWHGGELSVVTVDHGTRSDSGDDAAFVEQLCRDLGLVCRRFALRLGPSASEATCREGRLEVFDALDADVVALGHHADDQAETLLINLLRGTGTTGIAAMPHQRDRLVRPMLDVRRSEIESWATEHEPRLQWREDPTNRDPRFLRNRIRSEVLPLLEDLRPGATAALARSARVAGIDDDFLDRLLPVLPAGDAPLPLSVVARLPESLLRRALARWAHPVGASHVDSLVVLVRRGRGRVELPASRAVEVRGLNDDGAVHMVQIGV